MLIYKDLNQIIRNTGLDSEKNFFIRENSFQYINNLKILKSTKKNICKFLDVNNFEIKKLETMDKNNKRILRVCIRKKNEKYSNKICILGSYYNRYDLLGHTWDGESREFNNLGYDTLLVDVKDLSTDKGIIKTIINFKPKIILIGLKSAIPFIQKNIKQLRSISEVKIIYWFRDLRGIEGSKIKIPIKEPIISTDNLNKCIDYVFLNNDGQINEYKKYYKINNVQFLPDGYSPIFKRKMNLKKNYDIGFAGSMDNSIFHKNRTKLIEKLIYMYSLKIMSNNENDTPEFYNQCKIVFGAGVIDEHTDFHPSLYTSNRLYNTLGCGSFYLCNWFPNISKIFINHYHLVWFKNEKELFELINYYLAHGHKREKIAKQGHELALKKHTNKSRLQNLINIINNKEKEYNGYI